MYVAIANHAEAEGKSDLLRHSILTERSSTMGGSDITLYCTMRRLKTAGDDTALVCLSVEVGSSIFSLGSITQQAVTQVSHHIHL